MGLLCPHLVVVYFDAEGKYLSVQDVVLTVPPHQEGTTRIYWEEPDGTIKEVNSANPHIYITHKPEFRESLEWDIRNLLKPSDFVEQPIDIQEFFLEDRYLGIRLLPDYLEEFIKDPTSVAEDEEDIAFHQEILDEWKTEGKFILWWGKDYWFGADGEVEST